MSSTIDSLKHFFKYTYKSEIDIHSDKAHIWRVLSDCKTYPKWNPFTTQIDTSWKIGEEVYLTVQMKPNSGAMIRTEYLEKFVPEEEMRWGFSWGLFLRASRSQKLTQVGDKTTNYLTEDIIQGFLSPIVHLFFGKWVQRGFNAISIALKKYVESKDLEEQIR